MFSKGIRTSFIIIAHPINTGRLFHSTRLLAEKRWSRWEWPLSKPASFLYERKRDHGYEDHHYYDYEPHSSYISFSFLRDLCVTAIASVSMVVGIYACAIWYEQRQQPQRREPKMRTWSHLFPRKILYVNYLWKDIHSWETFKEYIQYRYNAMPRSTVASAALIAMNGTIFLLWRLPNPRLQLWMTRYFIHHVHKSSLGAQIASIPLCVFSHRDGYHILFNMAAGTSFMHVLLNDLSMAHFMAFYLSAGILSTLASHCSKYFTRSLMGGLGASGAIMAMMGYTISRFYHTDPERKVVSLIFFPFIQFNAQQTLYVLLATELAMFLFSKRVRIDHVAHLSGLALGWWYYVQGKDTIWPIRKSSYYIL
jgi:rhomboid-like protein